ncbi:MAG: S8 family peptidase [Lachnospiraceae bacterium]|nr:S8 family peptidase [Lachnospiraceae bacterium]
MAVYSDDYYDFIIDYNGGYPVEDAVCYQRVNDRFDVAYYARSGTPELNAVDYPYSILPKCFALTDQTAQEVSGILRLQNPAGLDLQGQGILVGFLDTGIDYTHPAFRNTDGTTRIAAMWDQTIEDGEPPEGLSYGAYYDESGINAALASEDPEKLVPERDENGHGTFLAGVACGSADPAMDFTGAAPLSQLLVVKCKQAKQYLREYYFVPEGADCYQENDLMLAMAWLNQMAERLRKPLIICVGMGSAMGSHAGEDAISALCDEIGRLRQRGIVVSAGNEANARHHYFRSGLYEGQTDAIEVSVGDRVPGFYLECRTAAPEISRVSVLSPTGERFQGTGAFSGRQSHVFLFEKTTLTVDYAFTGTSPGGQIIFLRFSDPWPGIWTVELMPVLAIEGNFHCWLPIGSLMQGEVFFLQPDPDTTILSPGFSTAAVTAGAYRAVGGGADPDSGRGYSVTGTVKPDVLAPGVHVYGPEPGIVLPGPGTGAGGAGSGTSVSAALTAGACAQIFQWGILEQDLTWLNSTHLTNILTRGAGRDSDRVYPDRVYGYGLLDVYGALDALRITAG